MRSTLIALATAGVLASGGAVAGTTNYGSATLVPVQYHGYTNPDRSAERSATINEREAQIRARIDRGFNDGRLTTWEARRLYRELASIEAKERAYQSDGRLNYREEAQLNRDLDVLAQNVRTQLRDDDRRYSYAR